MTLLRRIWERIIDSIGFAVFLLLGGLLTMALFLLRIIPDRERAAEERSREDAKKRADELKEKVRAAKQARDEALAAETARIKARADAYRRAKAVDVANALIRQGRRRR